jgi:hypothetical protein
MMIIATVNDTKKSGRGKEEGRERTLTNAAPRLQRLRTFGFGRPFYLPGNSSPAAATRFARSFTGRRRLNVRGSLNLGAGLPVSAG